MLTIVRNRTWAFDATIFDTYVGEGDPGNVPTNHTGWTIRSQIRKKIGNVLVANLNVTFPVPVSGTIAIRHERDFTRSLATGDYWWDIVATDAAGDDYVYVEPEPIAVRDNPTDPANATYSFVPGGGGVISHTHLISDVTGLQTALSGKQPIDADLTSWSGVTRAANFDTFTSTPSSANLRALVTDETGTGALVFAAGPTFAGLTNTGTLNLATGTTFTYGTGIASAHRTALGLGTLATQNGTSSGTNTGDQDLSNLLSRRTYLEVNGTTPLFGPFLVDQDYLTNGRRVWLDGSGASLFWDGSNWVLELDSGGVVYQATKASGSYEPWLLTGWTVVVGSGQPTFDADPFITNSADPLGSGVSLALYLPADTNGGFLTAGTGGTLPITRGGTGATTAANARIALGAGTTGATLFGAADAAAARTTLGLATADSPTFAGITASGTHPTAAAITATQGIYSSFLGANQSAGGFIACSISGIGVGAGFAHASSNSFFPCNASGVSTNGVMNLGRDDKRFNSYFGTNGNFSGILVTVPLTQSGPGALNVAASSIALTTTGVADALTLANGTNGQILTVCHVSRGGGTGTAVLTPTTKNGYTTITFTATGDSVTLQYHTTGGWHVIGSRGVTIA